MTADDAFVVHFQLESGAVGVLQSTAADWGPPIIETRIVGSRGTAWIDGLKASVWVADRNGTRQVPVGSDLRVGRPEPPPPGALRTTYERMIGHGLDVGPYTHLAEAFRDRILGVPVPPSPQPATFADGVAAMAVLDAVRRSDAIRTWVPVEG
jgi:predicted dehydrogenase